MSFNQNNNSNDKYRIGSVSRLTGIPTDTLRIWERRYEVVTPDRSESGTRFYSHADITRLALIKQLVDEGNAISTVANLDQQELEQRASLQTSNLTAELKSGMIKPCKIVICGDALPLFVRNKRDEISEINVVAEFQNPYEAEADLAEINADVLLMEFPAFQDQDIGPLQSILKRFPDLYPILVYGFATRSTLELLEKLNINTVRAPLDVYRLKSECQKALTGSSQTVTFNQLMANKSEIPARNFSQQQLVNLANRVQPNTVNCECPKHHADILYNLYAFEDYNIGCLTNNKQDALLHSYIYDCTVKARYMMEQSLNKLIETDNLEID